MRITREIDYALRIMNRLAESERIPARNGINAAAISDAICVPVKFTLKILRKLQSGSLVRSFKGAGGGYALAKAPSEVSLLDIMEAIDGPITINNCLDEGCECSRPDFDKKACFYYHIFDEINEMIAEKLRKVTLDNAVNNKTNKKIDGDTSD